MTKGLKKRLINILPAIPVMTVLGAMMISPSCANTTQAPTGGDKDTIPPVIVGINPLPGALNVPVEDAKFYFAFNEYVKVKDPKNIRFSPPTAKPPKAKLKNRGVLIYFDKEDSIILDRNTTYTINFPDAIQDNNEGNVYPGYTYVFSTGETIDSMFITGIVEDCSTLLPVKDVTVMMYKDLSDSAIFKSRPDAAAKTDAWGYFCIRNIPDTLYRLYAVKDENNNNRYDPDENELIAFVDSLIRPVSVVRDSLVELMHFDAKDTADCLSRKEEYELYLFREKPRKQYIVNKERLDDRTSYITFMAPKAHIDTMWIKGLPADRLITQFNIERDSLEIWVNDPRPMPDTFFLYVNYRKTDTMGIMRPFTEEVKLANPVQHKGARKSSTVDLKHEDTICVYKLDVKPENVEQEGFNLEFGKPIVNRRFDLLKFTYFNPKRQEFTGSVKVVADTNNLRLYHIYPELELIPGYEYCLKIPQGIFRDINGFYNDSLDTKVSLPSDEKLSTLSLVLSGVHHKYIVDMLNEKRDAVLRSYIIDGDTTLTFPYLKAGKYSIRMTEDTNRNSYVDSGSLLDHRAPEKVRFYKVGDTFLIEIPEMAEIQQEINMEELFK